MMACFGIISRAPLAVMLMVAEMTGTLSLIVPAMLAVGLATLIVRRSDDSIYRCSRIARSLAHRILIGLPLLAVPVSAAMVSPRCVLTEPIWTWTPWRSCTRERSGRSAHRRCGRSLPRRRVSRSCGTPRPSEGLRPPGYSSIYTRTPTSTKTCDSTSCSTYSPRCPRPGPPSWILICGSWALPKPDIVRTHAHDPDVPAPTRRDGRH